MAKQIEPGFIKIKHKLYKPYFSSENIELIWDFFKEHFSSVKGREINWDTEYYKDQLKGISNIPFYPETDVFDDSQGVQPKQLFKIIDLIGFENFKIFANILSKNVGMFVNNEDYFYTKGETRETTIIQWEDVVKKTVMPKIKDKDTLYFGKLIFCDAIGTQRMGITYTKDQFPYTISDELFKAIITEELEIEKILFFKTSNIYDVSVVLTPENINANKFFEDRRKSWKDCHDIIPRSNELLLLDPEYWDKKVFLESMERLYGTKNLSSLDASTQKDFIGFYKAFGKLLSYVAPMINNEKISKPSNAWPTLYRNDIPEGLKKILANSMRGIDIKLKVSNILNIYATMSHFEDSNDFILKRNRISVDDVLQLEEVGIQLAKMNEVDLKELKGIPWRHIGVFKKYNVRNTESILELFARTRKNKLSIPTVSGNIGQYKYEVLGKDDIRGLIAGNATNCCQHIPSGIGKSCVYYGAEHENSTFFIITDRAGTIVCQSWLWEKDNILICDSAEAVRTDALFYDCYFEMAQKVVNTSKKITEVRIGSKGRAFNNTLKSAESNVSLPQVPSGKENLYGEDGSVYSDASHQSIIFKD